MVFSTIKNQKFYYAYSKRNTIILLSVRRNLIRLSMLRGPLYINNLDLEVITTNLLTKSFHPTLHSQVKKINLF